MSTCELYYQVACPICGGFDQHKLECILSNKDHVYVDDCTVDWYETFKLNHLAVEGRA